MLDPNGGFVRGTLDVLILKALTRGPHHGYAVAERVKTITDSELLVEEGPLYGALHRLEKNGWLERAEIGACERYVRAVGKARSAPGTITA